MNRQYWAACQTVPGREHVIRSEIEKANRGAFLPTFAKVWASDGRVNAKECAAISGYVFFLSGEMDWAAVEAIEGVQQVLTLDGVDRKGNPARIAKQVTDEEMRRMVVDDFTGKHNRMDACTTRRRTKERGRSRKPRPGKRIRKATIGR